MEGKCKASKLVSDGASQQVGRMSCCLLIVWNVDSAVGCIKSLLLGCVMSTVGVQLVHRDVHHGGRRAGKADEAHIIFPVKCWCYVENVVMQ